MKSLRARVAVVGVTFILPALLVFVAAPTCGCGGGEMERDTTTDQLVLADTTPDTGGVAKEDSGRSDSFADTAIATTAADGTKEDTVKGEDPVETPEPKEDEKNDAATTGAGSGETEGCDEADDEMIAEGKEIFVGKGNCWTCHTKEGTGTALGPDLTDKKWIVISGDYASIIKNVRTGVPFPKEHPTPMPAMGGAKLSDDEVCAVSAYVWSLSR